MYKSSGKLVCPDLVEFVGAVALAGVGGELKILMLWGGIDDFNTHNSMGFSRGKEC